MNTEAAEVLELGGLHVVGTERHDARRIDLQLRGRAGRQGDAGSSRFFISLDDKLMRLFAGDFVKRIMQMAGLTEGGADCQPHGHTARRRSPKEDRRTSLRPAEKPAGI